jgi:hypothetical protein
MAKKAKRLVSESRTQLIDCRRLLHIVLFRTGTSPFSPEPRSHRPSIAAILFVLCEASSEGAGHYFAAGNAQAVISWRSISLEVDHACIID